MRWFGEGKLKAFVAGSFDLGDWVKAFKLIEPPSCPSRASCHGCALCHSLHLRDFLASPEKPLWL